METDDALTRYEPADATEAADTRRLREVLAGPDPWSRDTPVHLTGSALIVHPPTGRVLLRWHPRQAAWLQVGGHGDPGERDPLAVALREGVEETGLADLYPYPRMSTEDSAPLHVVVVPVVPNEREPAHEHVDVRYLVATDQPERARPERPEAPLRWLTVAEALSVTEEENLRETLRRAAAAVNPSL